MSIKYTFNEKLWLYHGEGAWYFITLPTKYAKEIKTITASMNRGFGSVRVLATIGNSTWNTSIFPDTKSKSYLLPIKKEIRLKNNLQLGEKINVEISFFQ